MKGIEYNEKMEGWKAEMNKRENTQNLMLLNFTSLFLH